jgi:hypothetical protein
MASPEELDISAVASTAVSEDGSKPAQPSRQHSARRPGPPSTAASAAHAAEATAAEQSPRDPAQQQHGNMSVKSVRDSQLEDVWHHLKHLEQAVKSHMQTTDGAGQRSSTQPSHGIGRGGSSILSAGRRAGATDASSSDDSAGEGSPAASARLSERAKLRDSLSKIKSEIAEKAIKEVEAQLLQQRVACLEAALAGLTGAGMLAATGPGCASCAGSLLSLSPGRASVCLRCQSQAQQPHVSQQQAPRASTPTRLEPGEPLV